MHTTPFWGILLALCLSGFPPVSPSIKHKQVGLIKAKAPPPVLQISLCGSFYNPPPSQSSNGGKRSVFLRKTIFLVYDGHIKVEGFCKFELKSNYPPFRKESGYIQNYLMTHSVHVENVMLKGFPHAGLMTHMKLKKKRNGSLKHSDRWIAGIWKPCCATLKRFSPPSVHIRGDECGAHAWLPLSQHKGLSFDGSLRMTHTVASICFWLGQERMHAPWALLRHTVSNGACLEWPPPPLHAACSHEATQQRKRKLCTCVDTLCDMALPSQPRTHNILCSGYTWFTHL